MGVDYFTDNSSLIYDPRHGDGASSNGVMQQGQQNILNTDIQNYINYNFGGKGHNVYLTAGQELQQTTSRFYLAQGTNISDLFFLKQNIITNSAVTQSIQGTYTVSAIDSYFGRLNYDYKGRYFVQASFRIDGQSSLAQGNKYGNFPGSSIGWRPVQEKFWKSVPFLNKKFQILKLKVLMQLLVTGLEDSLTLLLMEAVLMEISVALLHRKWVTRFCNGNAAKNMILVLNLDYLRTVVEYNF